SILENKYEEIEYTKDGNIVMREPIFENGILSKDRIFTFIPIVGSLLKVEEYDYKKQVVRVFCNDKENMSIDFFLQKVLKGMMSWERYKKVEACINAPKASRSRVSSIVWSLFDETMVLMNLEHYANESMRMRNTLIEKIEAEYKYLSYPEHVKINVEDITKQYKELLKNIASPEKQRSQIPIPDITAFEKMKQAV
ncbi:hypothetical protein ACFL4A_04455, partial [bacterium]